MMFFMFLFIFAQFNVCSNLIQKETQNMLLSLEKLAYLLSKIVVSHQVFA